MVTALWAYEGWQFVTYSAGEAVNPRRDFPRALFWGALFLTILYVVADFGYLVALGPQVAASSDVIASASLKATVGPWAAKLVALTILISVFSGMNSVVLTAPRVFYAMARDGLFFHKLAEVHPRRDTEIPVAERPFRVPGYPWTPLVFVASAFALVVNVIVATPWDAAKGLVIVALGCPVYWLLFRRKMKTAAPESARSEASS